MSPDQSMRPFFCNSWENSSSGFHRNSISQHHIKVTRIDILFTTKDAFLKQNSNQDYLHLWFDLIAHRYWWSPRTPCHCSPSSGLLCCALALPSHLGSLASNHDFLQMKDSTSWKECINCLKYDDFFLNGLKISTRYYYFLFQVWTFD